MILGLDDCIVYMGIQADEPAEKERKRSVSKKEDSSSPKKKKVKLVEVDLPDAPLDGKKICHGKFIFY